MSKSFWRNVAIKAKKIFYHPERLYGWDEIIQGVLVFKSDGSRKTMKAVAQNTWRAHHRKDRSTQGSSQIFEDFFIQNKKQILGDLIKTKDRQSLHDVENRLLQEIKHRLHNLKPSLINSFNIIRKPIDLYFQHLMAMAKDIPEEVRIQLVPFLFLPIDSQMMGQFSVIDEQEFAIFYDDQLNRIGLNRQSSYGHIKTQDMYLKLQHIVDQRAKEISIFCDYPFHPIYFDMLWGKRYMRNGANLFELNP